MMEDLNKLNCREVYERLDDFIDQALDGDDLARVAKHLEKCRHCSGEHELTCSMVRSIKEKLRRLKAPENLKARIGNLLTKCWEEAQPKEGES